MNKKRGTGMIRAGLLILTAALLLILYNIYLEGKARESTLEAVAFMETVIPEEKETVNVPETLPQVIKEMPEVEINGQNYIGTLEIPTLELTLGIISHWNEERLQIAPCRYAGSAYTDDLVIAAHNYNSHFGKLKELQPGDGVLFTDTEGKTVEYYVVIQEILMPEDVEEMTDGRYDLTLFTCTYGGKSRVTVRCDRSA